MLEQRTEFPETENRTEYKNHLKRLVYRCLSEYTGQKLPWGDLTGIRPVKIPLRLLEEGRTNGEIAACLADKSRIPEWVESFRSLSASIDDKLD